MQSRKAVPRPLRKKSRVMTLATLRTCFLARLDQITALHLFYAAATSEGACLICVIICCIVPLWQILFTIGQPRSNLAPPI